MYSASSLNRPLFVFVVNSYSFYYKMVTINSITLKFAENVHTSIHCVHTSFEELSSMFSKVRKDQVTSGNLCSIANVFKPGKGYLAELRRDPLQPAHTMVLLSLQQVRKLNSRARHCMNQICAKIMCSGSAKRL